MGAQACAELAGVEGLGDVVVGAHFQADHDVDLGAAAGQHHDRAGDALAAHLAANLDPADVGQHPIQQDEVGFAAHGGLDALAPGGRLHDVVTVPPADLAHDRAD